jgi:rubrerythrin
MNSDDLSLFGAVGLAKEAERKAEEFYMRAARRTLNPSGHRLFRQLAGFEHQHFERLAALARSLATQSAFTGHVEAVQVGTATSEVGAIPDESPKSAMDILAMALGIEEKARKRYTELAERTDDPAGREMFTRLAAEEHQHHRTLTNAVNSLDKYGVWDWSAHDA